MFGFGKRKEVYQVIENDESRKPLLVMAESYKEAEKSLPNEYREDLKRGKAKMSRLA